MLITDSLTYMTVLIPMQAYMYLYSLTIVIKAIRLLEVDDVKGVLHAGRHSFNSEIKPLGVLV